MTMRPWVIRTETLLPGSAERVWAELSDLASHRRWNPFLRSASGRLRVGERLRIRLALDHHAPLVLRPVVTVFRPPRELRWLARIGRPGLFDADRSFEIFDHDDRSVRFVMSETCSGILAPVLAATNLEAQLYRGYDKMNQALLTRLSSRP